MSCNSYHGESGQLKLAGTLAMSQQAARLLYLHGHKVGVCIGGQEHVAQCRLLNAG